MPGVPGYLWLLPLCFLPLHRGLRVQRAPGVPCALFGRKILCIARARCAASAKLFVPSLRAQRSNPSFFLLRLYGLLRFARNDGLCEAAQCATRSVCSLPPCGGELER